MGGNITINKRTSVHAGSMGVVTSPDVCKTPSKCRAKTYSNVAKSTDSALTAITVFVNGNPVCHKKSIFSISSGDEPGGCGGINSGTVCQKAEFITCSENVFIEGNPAVRQYDLMVSNNRNTPPMPLQQPGAGMPPELKLEGAGEIESMDTGYELNVEVMGESISLQRDVIALIDED